MLAHTKPSVEKETWRSRRRVNVSPVEEEEEDDEEINKTNPLT